ncbi:MAG: macro domain-containing protein [Candidatus Kerfeldbacteria bacterium]|nr:macro domain-containing protein [Candidatus Kerfeldbacteria bacterium]
MELRLRQGDILTATTAVIAYPADSAGQVGTAILQDGRIQAPTMKHATEPIPPKQVELATVAALRCADEAGFTSVALPPFGTTTGQVDLATAAKIMMETIQMFRCDRSLQTVEVWLPSPEALSHFQHYV